jgi:hypothetical protein
MKVAVYDSHGNGPIGSLEREREVCGRDFCDECGDCLHCYGDDPCVNDGVHRWLYYLNDLSQEDRVNVEFNEDYTGER